jgi:hypothetical protein
VPKAAGREETRENLGVANIHPNPSGYDRMAETWFNQIQAVAPVPEPTTLSRLA